MRFEDAFDITRMPGTQSAAQLNDKLRADAEAAVDAIPGFMAKHGFAEQARAALADGDWRAAIGWAEAAAEKASTERWT